MGLGNESNSGKDSRRWKGSVSDKGNGGRREEM